MNYKDTYIVFITDSHRPGKVGVGECALFRGLSKEDNPDYESRLEYFCNHINDITPDDIPDSSIKFGLETALLSINARDPWHLMPNDWSDAGKPIPINGLVWMGDFETMSRRLDEKIQDGFTCIKIKIGGIEFNKELELISYIRNHFSNDKLTIRLDANGAFTPGDALNKLDRLARYDIHSIEQPIRAGQWDKMKYVSKNSPIPIALDEELIGNMNYDERNYLLDGTDPSYIILKPSLHGGFSTCDRWIVNAVERGIGWWATSALESNIGLNAIAQWVATKNNSLPQGLGTGALYTNNFASPITVMGGQLYYKKGIEWDETAIKAL